MKKRTLILTALTVFTIAMAGCQTSSNTTPVRIPDTTSTKNQMNADSPEGTSDITNPTSATNLTEEDAKSIALTDAGVKESDVANIRIERDTDDGIIVYDVDFYAGNKEYDYEIDASSGEIRSKDSEIEDDFLDDLNQTATNAGLISETDAAKIALSKVEGASEQNLRISLDRDDGKDIYEGEIRYNGMEYEFELNAKTGDILEWSKEREDD